MTSYNCSIHQVGPSYTQLATFDTVIVRLADEREFDAVNQLCQNKTNMAGYWKWTFMPIRTDRDYLVQDLILPTLNAVMMEEATKASRTFGVFLLFALLWDAATLPIRLLFLPIRICYNVNVKPSEHPLTSYLRTKGINRWGQVHVLVYKEVPTQFAFALANSGGPGVRREGTGYSLHLASREVPYEPSQWPFMTYEAS
jgi:hypothetical protein